MSDRKRLWLSFPASRDEPRERAVWEPIGEVYVSERFSKSHACGVLSVRLNHAQLADLVRAIAKHYGKRAAAGVGAALLQKVLERMDRDD